MKRADSRELEKWKHDNFVQRLKFIDEYVDWLKRTPNKIWSRQLAKMLDG
jgi:hypothetical protein